MIKPFYIVSFIALSYGFPTETTLNLTNTTKTPSTGLIVKRQYSKPRIVSNIYRSNPGFMSPINPMENLLLYILLSAGKDLDDEDYQRENGDIRDRKRSPDIFTDALGDLVNGTKGVFTKIEETFRGPRETFTDLEIRPAHPISQEGTCMCFNRIIRTKSNHRFEPILHSRITTRDKIKNDDFKEKNFNGIKRITSNDEDRLRRTGLDEGLKVNFINSSGNSSLPGSVRILRVSDLIGDTTEGGNITEINSSNFHLDNNKIDDLDEMMLELEQTSQRGGNVELKKRGNVDRGPPPPWLENLKSSKDLKKISFQKSTTLKDLNFLKDSAVKEKRNDSVEKLDNDDGYYFLFYSGGTENRTTANENDHLKHREPNKIDLNFSNFLRRLQHFKNDYNAIDLIDDENERESLKIIKREDNKNESTGDNKDNKNEKEPPPSQPPPPLTSENDKNDSKSVTTEINEKQTQHSSEGDFSPTNATQFPDDDDEDVPEPDGSNDKAPTNTYLYSVTLPTALCIILLIVALCFLVRPAGRCCERFLRNPNDLNTERVIKPRGNSPKGSGRGSRIFKASEDDLDNKELERSRRGSYYGRGTPQNQRGNVGFVDVERRRYPGEDYGGLKRGNENVMVDVNEGNWEEVKNEKVIDKEVVEKINERNVVEEKEKSVPFGDN